MKKDLIKNIQLWLINSNDYQAGLSLFIKTGSLPKLASLLSKKPKPSKLKYELEKLVKNQKPLTAKEKQPPLKTVSFVPEKAQAKINVKVKENKPVLVKYNAEFKTLLDERRALFANGLIESKPQEEVHKVAIRIEEIGDLLDGLNTRKAYFVKHGHERKNKVVETKKYSSTEEILKRIENLKRYVRRDKGNQQKLDQWNAELVQLKNKLDA